MPAELLDITNSLLRVMEEETALLQSHAHREELPALVRSKLRLAGALEARMARMNREQPSWVAELESGMRADLADGAKRLETAAQANRALLARQIELSEDILAAVEGEMRRRRGSTATAYGSGGEIWRTDLANPLAINAKL